MAKGDAPKRLPKEGEKRLITRLPDDTHEKLVKDAAAEHRSLNSMIITMIEAYKPAKKKS